MSGFVSGEVRVSVPATSANLGPGFDALGLALDLRDVVTASVSDELRITVDGADEVPLDETHLVRKAMVRAFDALGALPTPVAMHCANVIPHSRGLGSSSAAIVAGLAIGRALVVGGSEAMDDTALFELAAQIEGHPDNVAPAVFGGFTIAFADGAVFRAVSTMPDLRVRAVVMVPATPVETKVARGLLPAQVSHRDAAVNAGRAALLVAALTGRPELLLEATQDRLHQDYREPAMPETLALVRRLRDAGHAAVVSGAGPTVLVLTEEAAVETVAGLAPSDWRVLRPEISPTGFVVG